MMPNADLSGDMLIIFIGVAVFVLAILVLLFTKRLGMFLLTIGVLAVIAVIALSMLSQAEASREAAKAAKTAATAATVASVGQTANSFALAMLSGALIVVTLIALGGVGYFWIRVRQAENERITNIRAQRQARSGKWASGPNALWGRADAPALGNVSNDIWAPVLIGQLMALQQTLIGQANPLHVVRPPSAPRYADSVYPPDVCYPPDNVYLAESWTDDEEWGANDGEEDLWAVKF